MEWLKMYSLDCWLNKPMADKSKQRLMEHDETVDNSFFFRKWDKNKISRCKN